MDQATTERLRSLNRQFYTDFGREFSDTRARLQPGVLRILGSVPTGGSILDLGCGNGELARTLSRRAWGGYYLGVDFSLPLLNEAGREAFTFPVRFVQADLTTWDWAEVGMRNPHPEVAAHGRLAAAPAPTRPESFDLVFCFALLHHIPGFDLRLNVVRNVYELLKPKGMFIHSNWQFLTSPRWVARIQPWETIGLGPSDVDPDDYLLDWKRGGRGLRYVHHFGERELEDLAKMGGFAVTETFSSDGENKRSSLYQVWQKWENR